MRKYGKYEKRPPNKPAAKQPQVKSILLQTYFTSLICLVLCVTMFFGTSYAWFTSEVTNASNEIYVGTLKVGLYKGNTDLANSEEKLFGSNIRWEPGYTALETITVKNEGDLAFKYELTFTGGTLAEGSTQTLKAVADNFEIWVFNHFNQTNAAPSSYEAITQSRDWKKVGTLAEVLAGRPVLSENMVTVRRAGQDAAAVNAGTADGVATADTYTVALHMKEDASSDVMSQRIKLNVKLVAYQISSNEETDGFGNQSYDEGIVVVSDGEELREAVENGKNVLMTSDIALQQAAGIAGGMLDGGGKQISGEYIVTAAGSDVQISNLTVKTALMPWGNTVLRNCSLEDAVLDVSNLGAGAAVTLTDCTYNGKWIGNAVLTSDGTTVTVSGSSAITVNTEKMVVLSAEG